MVEGTGKAPSRGDDRLGGYRVQQASPFRLLTMDAFTAIESGHPMLALLELDVTEAQARIAAAQAAGARVSLFAYVVRAIARALSEHPALHVVRHGGRMVVFDDVDVSVPVEVDTSQGRLPYQLVVRRAQAKSAEEIYADIEAARREYGSTGALGEEDRWSRSFLWLFTVVPRFIRLRVLRWLTSNPLRVKRRAGTTAVTSVGKLATIPGFVIPFTGGPRATSFAVGSVVDKPAVRDGLIVPRTFLSLTVVIDHDVVDGGPAARFASRLQELVEHPER
jgi:pyruvate/2-oxoglutarate dehydrogenase complex dihydrolipoamide acyltransferase (E2) component